MSSMIIGRKQIILAALVVALGAAIFLNYRFNQNAVATAATASTNYGDAKYVANQSTSAVSGTSDYFAQARLERQKTHDEALETLQSVVSASGATAAQKAAVASGINQLASNIKAEGDIETLVMAKGFKNCVAVIGDSDVNVIVQPKSGTLSEADAAQIDEIVMEHTKFTADKIKIIQAK